MEDLLAADAGKHDYDWLLTPPGTPVRSLSSSMPQMAASTRSNLNGRSVSTTRTSKLSGFQPEDAHPTRPARGNSAARGANTMARSSSYLSTNIRTSALNTSSNSISLRPSTPGTRPSSPAPSSRSFTEASRRPVSARSSTPTRNQPPSGFSAHKPLRSTRPSTPTSRPRHPIVSNTSSNPTSVVARSSSRPSTPTRCTPAATTVAKASTANVVHPPTGRASPAITKSRATGPGSRPSSPVPKSRGSMVVPLDFSMDVPPNLRTKLPERPASAGRMRPGTMLTANASISSVASIPFSYNRRNPSPISTRGRLTDSTMKQPRPQTARYEATPPEIRKPVIPNELVRKPVKPVPAATESARFGRLISKKSLDTSLTHMDIRQGMGSIRGAPLYPQSVRPATARTHQARAAAVAPHPGGAKLHMLLGANGRPVSRESKGMVSTDCSASDATTRSPGSDSPAAERPGGGDQEFSDRRRARFDSMARLSNSRVNMNSFRIGSKLDL